MLLLTDCFLLKPRNWLLSPSKFALILELLTLKASTFCSAACCSRKGWKTLTMTGFISFKIYWFLKNATEGNTFDRLNIEVRNIMMISLIFIDSDLRKSNKSNNKFILCSISSALWCKSITEFSPKLASNIIAARNSRMLMTLRGRPLMGSFDCITNKLNI